MYLTPKELERLTIFTAAEIARRRKERGIKLNVPEAIAYITDQLIEGAREDKTVAQLMAEGATMLTTDDVLPGVPELIPLVQVEAQFPDGTKLISIHNPIRMPEEQNLTISSNANTIPGEILCEPGTLELNAGRAAKKIMVANIGDRPIQVGSHYHFFEVNRALQFDRPQAFGFRLDIPAGTAIRFEPGDTKEVTLVAIAGERQVYGLNSLANGSLDSPSAKSEALEKMQALGFGMVQQEDTE